ncbi:rhoGEF domain-containing protein [Ditylenchus destructor]|uniref:RhoGEF domain-containing protein n=1 Tax=Ditylenchus destructor TaxID=166010 RepID=A0AAD4R138_9BILA|nr:rhoGEF domain-containing protein [Ditylenchus destructor]
MATRRQKQLDRKYGSYRKYTASEDVNYLTHSTRSSFKAESSTSRVTPQGQSSSTEVVSGTETRSLPVFIALQDYTPDAGDAEAIPLEQGQIVEVLDNKNASSWLVRTKARPPQTGWVPGSYFETPTNYYKQRRQTRELADDTVPAGSAKLTEEQEAVLKRDQVYHDLLKTEEDFVVELQAVIENYIRSLSDPTVPAEVEEKKNELTHNLRELYNFHANVMLKGLQYYSDDPGKVGQTFIRLERDFEKHVSFSRELPNILKLIEEQPAIKQFLQNMSDKLEAGTKSYTDYLQLVGARIKQYEEFFKEIIKYSARAQTSTKNMQKALELIQSIPKRASEVEFTKNILNYPGDTARLGRIYRHDQFQVWEGDQEPQDKYIFLFRNKMMLTDRDNRTEIPTFKHYSTIRVDKYTVRQHTTDEDAIVFRPNEPGLPSFRMRAKDIQSQEFVRKAWLKDITEMQEAIGP